MHATLVRLIPAALLVAHVTAFGGPVLGLGKRQDGIPTACQAQCQSFADLAERLTDPDQITPEFLLSICTAEVAGQFQECFTCAVDNGVEPADVSAAAGSLQEGCQAIGSPIPPFVIGGATITPTGGAGPTDTDTGAPTGTDDGGEPTTSAPTTTRATTTRAATTPTTSPKSSTGTTSTKPTTSGPASTTPAAASQMQVQTGLLSGLLIAALAFLN